jgi:hypothetical protein
MQVSHDARGKRVYADGDDAVAMLLCTEDLSAVLEDNNMRKEPYEAEAPLDLQQLHKQACESIHVMARVLHDRSVPPHLHTYINAYELWYACVDGMRNTENQQPEHPKHDAAAYLQRMPLSKLAVLLPVVCFWISVKCCDVQTLALCAQKVLHVIREVHTHRGDMQKYTYKELLDTEHAVVQLLDFDFLRSQEKIDNMENIIRVTYKDDYDSKNAQREILRIIFDLFNTVGIY